MKKKAYGKLNLGLNVIRKRSDGYHDLQMVTVPVDLFDTVEIIPNDTLSVVTDKWYLPLDEKNTVYQAIKLMHEEYGTPLNYHVKLVKNIPTQAGMAGGSSDGATAINIINEMNNLNLSQQQLIDIGVKIGADVPYCLFSRPSLVTGIGDQLQFLDIYTDFHLFIAKPKFGISTGSLFSNLTIDKANQDEFNQLVEGLTRGNYSQIEKNLVNDLQAAAIKVRPEVQEIIDDLKAFGFDNACMTGAGSVVFGITQSESLARSAVTEFYLKYPFVKKTKIITNK
ncbi:MAG TPA: 4-(cytidine 5'-diphospho)-2-C-methyl-D-erythritol kinase [Erysipelothrix sp.]|nr:4-(cytidine 5'-diphospho)-2-C-methyl-D-erythritol kinase [Erysipelothrix sp.]